MWTDSNHSKLRRWTYAILFAIAIIGFLALVGLSFVRGGAPIWVWVVFPLAGLVGPALLCGWCAIYVREEPIFVRIALGWIAFEFLFVTAAVFSTGGKVH